MKGYLWRVIVVLVVVIGSVVMVAPTFNPKLWPHRKINLGLDLQGGMHLALQVQLDKAVASVCANYISQLKSDLRKEKIRYSSMKQEGPSSIILQVPDPDDADRVEKIIEKEYPDLIVKDRARHDDYDVLYLDMKPQRVASIEKQAVEQALETIRNRIDQFGVSEPDIRLQGTDRILVQLPGIRDIRRAKELIGKTAQLEFKLLDEEHDLAAALRGDVPPGSEILYASDEAKRRTASKAYLVKKETLLTGAHLKDARVAFDRFNEPYVAIEFDRKGARIFEEITGANVRKRLAIVLDNKVYSAPVIQERIAGGSARITGDFTVEEAHDLAIVLRAGALPAPVKIVEERTVGPSLGKDSIQKGLFSMAVGGIVVVLFMAVYYSVAGLLADVALILNILLIGAGLAAFGATLTLPGIAGIILTIGMAVDANVIVFERIREEKRKGKTPVAAIDAGFARSTVTVMDANVTTLIAALVLYQFGTGPVKGFAVTLSLGVLASLFTALFVCRLMFDYLYGVAGWKELKI